MIVASKVVILQYLFCFDFSSSGFSVRLVININAISLILYDDDVISCMYIIMNDCDYYIMTVFIIATLFK